jgi:hypothetical protein
MKETYIFLSLSLHVFNNNTSFSLEGINSLIFSRKAQVEDEAQVINKNFTFKIMSIFLEYKTKSMNHGM